MTEQLHEFFKTQSNLEYFISKLSQKSIKSILSDLEIKVPRKSKFAIDLSNNDTLVFTDGSALNNGKPDVRSSFSVLFNDSPHLNHTKIMTNNLSNNGAELSAILYAVKIISENSDLFINKNIIIVSDSLYAIKCITTWSKKWIENGWVTSKGISVQNLDIIQEILKYTPKLNITFKHIFSHQKEPVNIGSIEHIMWLGNDTVDKNCLQILS